MSLQQPRTDLSGMTTEERRLHRLARIRRRKELGPIPNRHPMTDLSNMTKEEKRLRIE